MIISEILKLADKTDVDFVRGNLVEVWRHYSGINSSGDDYQIQNCLLEDSSGRIKLKISGHNEIPANWKNQPVIIEAGVGTKKPHLGLRKNHEVYKEKTTIILEVDDRCTITKNSGQASPPPRTDPPHDDDRPPPEQREMDMNANRPPKSDSHPESDCVRELKRLVGQKVNLMWMCWEGADLIREYAIQKGKPLDSGHFQAMCATFYINFEKMQLPENFPAKPLFHTKNNP